MSVKERIKEFIYKNNLSISEFEKSIGASNGYVNSISKSIGIDKLNSILEKYPNINIEWLLTGKGDMLREELPAQAEPVEKDKGIPLIPTEVFAGTGGIPLQIKDYEITDYYKVPEFNRADFLIRVFGDSMYPTYNNGDVAACKLISSYNVIQWGHAYVLHEKEQGAMIKRLFPSKNKNKNIVICRSDNKLYDDFEINMNNVNALALVIGFIRVE
jgi:phage repressor protein C with HTH and peptisase S24 domain